MNIAPYIFMVTPSGRERSARLTMFAGAMKRAWKLALLRDEPGWLALGDRDAPCIDLPDGGLIWGQLFTNAPTRVITTPTEDDPLLEPAEQFVGRYWGGYLAIRRSTGGIEVLRDPSGGIPCYMAEIDGTHVLTSQPHLLFDAGLLTIEIDWTIVAQSLAFRDIKPAHTALRGMSELLPGVAAEIGPHGTATRCIWSPWDFARADVEIDDFSSATTELREVALKCIAAYAGRYQQAVVEISGGLDSAIVAAGLALAGKKPACVNFWPAAGDPDERPYARAIAEKLQLDLDEVPLDVSAVDLASSHARNLPRASARTFAQAMDRTTRDVGMRVGADAFFGGSGGIPVKSR